MKDRRVVGTCKPHFHKYKSIVNVKERVKQKKRKKQLAEVLRESVSAICTTLRVHGQVQTLDRIIALQISDLVACSLHRIVLFPSLRECN